MDGDAVSLATYVKMPLTEDSCCMMLSQLGLKPRICGCRTTLTEKNKEILIYFHSKENPEHV